ncbi:MAG: hypothetical protein O3A25_17400 [Acidobacteria bacterium]|nr:hypothetical protein [Acidobacteriota bacterium]
MCLRFLLAVGLGLLWLPGAADAQLTYSRGQSVSPAFEGWWQNEDGTYTLFFGYMNDNWEEELDVPVGPENNIEPGGPDRGQPTHFLPRRNMFLFQVQVPADFGDQELVWTLTTHGTTHRTYASLRSDYLVDKQVIGTEVGANRGGVSQDWQWNEPPEVNLGVDQRRRVRVGEELPLVAFATDADGIPSSTKAGVTLRPSTPRDQSERHPAYRPPQQVVPGNPNGLRLSWFVYRGAGQVTFNPVQLKVWQDTRPYANSPWSPPFEIPPVPPDGKWEAVASFEEPGTYVLRALASDGALFTAQDIVVTVTP